MEERRMMGPMFRPCFFWLFVMLLLWPRRPCNLENVVNAFLFSTLCKPLVSQICLGYAY